MILLEIRTQIPSGDLSERTTIAVGAALRREHKTDGTPISHVRGATFYDDALGVRHHTTFCRILDSHHRLVAPSKPGYNYGD